MANEEHFKILMQGIDAWNRWRRAEENSILIPDLTRADLSDKDLREGYFREVNFSGANLIKTNFRGANLSGSVFIEANLFGADLSRAKLMATDFYKANLRDTKMEASNFLNAKLINADMRGARLIESNINDATFRGADLRNANFFRAQLFNTDLSETKLNGANLNFASLCQINLKEGEIFNVSVYGTSAWEVELEGAKQSNLIITKPDEPKITVDNLEVAQFIYLLLHNEKIRYVIDTITSKVVLILGRFSETRKPVLDQLRDALRDQGFAPVLFDFDKPASKDITGTVETLARMARFIVADLTDPSSIPHELATIVPFMRTTPVVPIRFKGSGGYSMFDDLEAAYNWVLPKYEYENDQILIESVSDKIIEPAVAKLKELRGS